LQERIRARARKFGPLIFGEHTTESMDVITDVWRRKLKKLWSLCEGPDFKWKEKPTPHRFRHTFARILLQRPGVTVRDVAELLGDTEDMVRRHYAAWVPERQERLTAALKAAFAEKPKPKVVEFPKRTGTEA
jgi:integrase